MAHQQQRHVHGHGVRPVQVIEYQDAAADGLQCLRRYRLRIARGQRAPDRPPQRQALHPGQRRKTATLENPQAASCGGGAEHRGLSDARLARDDNRPAQGRWSRCSR